MNCDLPSFVVMHKQKPRGDDQIWSPEFLPKSHQALAIDARWPITIDNLNCRKFKFLFRFIYDIIC